MVGSDKVFSVVFSLVAGFGVFALLFVGSVGSAFAQQGPQTIEPTLEECRAFVDENGVPDERPFGENRGYSGWDVCLSLAYDGDLAGGFAASDGDGDGVLSAAEQRVYVSRVMGGRPVGDSGPVDPVTIEKCRAMVEENGLPASDPLATISGGSRAEFEVAMCQSLAMSGDLDSAFAAADVNDDGALDLPEQTDYQRSVAAPIRDGGSGDAPPLTVEQCEAYVRDYGLPESDPLHFYRGGSRQSYDIAVCQSLALTGDLGGAFASADTSGDGVLDQSEETDYARNLAAGADVSGGAAQGQYEQTGPEATGAIEESTASVSGAAAETTGTAETTAETTTEQTTQPETPGGASGGQDGGVLSAVGSIFRGDLPSSGGVTLLGLAGAAALIVGGGVLAYRSRR